MRVTINVSFENIGVDVEIYRAFLDELLNLEVQIVEMGFSSQSVMGGGELQFRCSNEGDPQEEQSS